MRSDCLEIEYVSGFASGLNSPLSEAAKAAKQESIAEKLSDITERLAQIEGKQDQINQAFCDAWHHEQTKHAEYNGGVWGRVGEGFFWLPKQYTLLHTQSELQSSEVEWLKNLEALVALNQFLEINGVQLMVVMYPHHSTVASRALMSEFAQYSDEKELRIAQRLLEHNIEVITFSDRAVKKATSHPFMFFYPDNFHPGEGTGEVASEVIAEHMTRFASELTPRLNASDFEKYTENNVYDEQFVYPKGVDVGSNEPGGIVRISKTYYRGKPIKFDEDSKVLVCGHSFIQTPAHSAYLSSAIAGKIQYIPHHFRISSVGPYTSIPRRLLTDREALLRGKRVCVLVFDSYFGISKTIQPVNIREIDNRLLAISHKEMVFQHDLKNTNTPPLEQNELLNQFVKAAHADPKEHLIWQIPASGTTVDLATIELPDDLNHKQDLWLLLEFNLNNKHLVEIEINDDMVTSEFHQIPTWQEIFIALTPGNQNINLRLKTFSDDTLFSIRKIAIYQ